MLPPVNIVVPTYNRGSKIRLCIDSLLKLNYPKYEVVVVNDGSTDDTKEILKEYGKKIHLVSYKTNKGFSAANNIGIKSSKHPYIAFLTDDCIVDKNWLRNLVKGFTSKDIAVVAGQWEYMYMSSCHRKSVLFQVGLFDETMNECYREDTDLIFRIQDDGYKIARVHNAKFIHNHPAPPTWLGKIKYGIRRIFIHKWDVYLYKKNPERAKKFFNVRLGFLISPVDDFKRATGLWGSSKEFSLSSPQGILILKGNNIFYKIIIFLFGIVYALLLKFIRLYGSIKFKKLLL